MSIRKLKQVLRSDIEIPLEVECRISDTLSSLGAEPIRAFVPAKPVKMRSARRIIVIVAVIILALSVTAMAASPELRETVYGIRGLLLNYSETPSAESSAEGADENRIYVDGIPQLMISQQGFSNSPEFMAAMEWAAFEATYDPDGAILNRIGNNPTGLDEVYEWYFAYTQEMADKIDEIAARYGLSLHKMPVHFLHSGADLFRMTSMGNFLGAGNSVEWAGYIFASGTFKFEGAVDLGDKGIVDYQFRYNKKGYFNNVFINITADRIDAIRDQVYDTACGTTVLLITSPDHSLIIADLHDAFVTINIPFEGRSFQVLEMLADTFDFAKINMAQPSGFSDIIEIDGDIMSQMAGFWRMDWPNPDNAAIMILSADGSWESPGPLPTDHTSGGSFVVTSEEPGIYHLRFTIEHTTDPYDDIGREFGDYIYDAQNDRLFNFVNIGKGIHTIEFLREH